MHRVRFKFEFKDFERKALCREILNNRIYKNALECNGEIGNPAQMLILYLFKHKRFAAVKVLCRIGFYALNYRDKELEKLWDINWHRYFNSEYSGFSRVRLH